MPTLYEEFEATNNENVNEDKQIDVINELTDDEDLAAAEELILEELGEPKKGTSSNVEAEPENKESTDDKKEKGGEGTSEETKKDDEEPEQKASTESEKKEQVEEEIKPSDEDGNAFVLTDEVINSQPEEVRGLLSKYKGKGKSDLANVAANAVAFKNEYLKDNKEAIAAVAKKFEGFSDEELLKTLVNTQKETGKQPEQKAKKLTGIPEKENLPPLPEDNEEVKNTISAETVKRLKVKYPKMPDDMTSIEHKEWLKELQEDDIEAANDFLQYKKEITANVKNDLQKVVFLQKNYREINNNMLEDEVSAIKSELEKYGITDPGKQLGVNLSLAKDNDGSYFNEGLNSLMLKGEKPDPDIVNFVGKIPLLIKGRLVKKFLFENNAKILTYLSNRQVKNTTEELNRVKETNLNTLGNSKSSGSGSKAITLEEIDKITDTATLDKAEQDILSQL